MKGRLQGKTPKGFHPNRFVLTSEKKPGSKLHYLSGVDTVLLNATH